MAYRESKCFSDTARDEGRIEGRAEGELCKAQEVAVKAVHMGMNEEQISLLTDLSSEEIQFLHNPSSSLQESVR